MSKFNVRSAQPAKPSGFIQMETVSSGMTFEHGTGFAHDEKSELFLLAVTNFVSESTFYEGAADRDNRYVNLVRSVAVQDPAWLVEFVLWLRQTANMRTAALVAGLEGAKALVDAKIDTNNRVVDAFTAKPSDIQHLLNRSPRLNMGVGAARLLASAGLNRADEPGEALAYWTSKYGMKIPKPIKRGIADAASRLYNEYSLLKYDTSSHAFRFGRVLDLVHAKPAADKALWQGALFQHAQDRMRGNATPDDVMAKLKMVQKNAEVREDLAAIWAIADREDLPVIIKSAGLTWEDVLSAIGSKVDKKLLWEALIPSMGYMALLRNLRNFDEAGVSNSSYEAVAKILADPEHVATSRQLPLRFLSAFKNVNNVRWHYPLEQALNLSLRNIPALSGRTLILVDHSGSMWVPLSSKSQLSRHEAARIFGSAIALRSADPTLVVYGSSYSTLDVPRGGSILSMMKSFPGSLGGTYTWGAAQATYKNHDRIIVLTDEQSHDSWSALPGFRGNTYIWNLAGYRMGTAPSVNGVYTFGGLSDASFGVIDLIEAGKNGVWPWEQKRES